MHINWSAQNIALLLILTVQVWIGVVVWQLHSLTETFIQQEEEISMPSRTTDITVTITIGGTSQEFTDHVTTTQGEECFENVGEPSAKDETRAEWNARHVATVKAALAVASP